MSPERQKAREKQTARGNSPRQTRASNEIWDDFGRYRTGLHYRKWLNQRLKEHAK